MRWIRRLRARIRYRHHDTELARELETHREWKEAELREEGLSDREARAAAARALGNVTLQREVARGVWFAPWLESVWQDVRYTARSLRRSPGFAAMGLATLILGIGLNTSFFSVVNSVLLRPWQVPDADEMVLAFARREIGRGRIRATGVSAVEYRYLHERARTVNLLATRGEGVRLGAEPHAETLHLQAVSGNYFDALQVPFVVGRGFKAAEDHAGAPIPVAVLSHELWRNRFSASTDVAGTVITLNDVAFAVIGVTDRHVASAPIDHPANLWIPLASLPLLNPTDKFSQQFLFEPGHCCVDLAGRLRRGASRAEAQAELAALDRQVRDAGDGGELGMIVTGTAVAARPDSAELATVFLLITIGLLMMLLVACANLGNLQLARAMARRRELAIRCSLGASRRRVVRQLLTEGLALAAAAAGVAVLVSVVLPNAVLRIVAADDAVGALDVRADARVVLFAVLLAALSVVVGALAPAVRSTRRLAIGRYQEDAGRLPLRSLLLAVQVGFSVVLLLASALVARGVDHAASSDPGFAVQGIAHFEIDVPAGAQRSARSQAASASVRAALKEAGILEVADTNIMPLTGSASRTGVRLPQQGENENVITDLQDVSPEFFSLLRIPVKDGRILEPNDPATDVVINETLAAALWPGERAIGRTFTGGRVIGVVGDARLIELDQLDPTLYRRTSGRPTLLVRDQPGLADRVRAAVAAVEPEAAVRAGTLEATMRASLGEALTGAAMASTISLISIALAMMGVFGVFSYVVDERRREIAVRMAIGARARNVLGLVYRQSAWPLLGGLGAGLLASMAVAPLLGDYLFGLNPRDPIAMAVTIAVLALAAIAATWLPARRAMRVDPALTLRTE
jgi:predicted permease